MNGLPENFDLLHLLARARTGDVNAARMLFAELAARLLCRDRRDITPLGRRVLSKILLKLSRGESPDVATMLKHPGGQPRWEKIDQEFGIFGDMLKLVDPAPYIDEHGQRIQPEGIKASAAARLIADSGAYPGVSAKRMQNIFSDLRKLDAQRMAEEFFPEFRDLFFPK